MNTSPITLDATAVERLLPHVDVLQEMRQLFTGLGNAKAVQPPQTLALLPQNKGDFITYLGADTNAGVFGAKLSPYLVTSGKPIITAWTVLMSAQTGQPLCLCDAGRLTTERTAATTALAVDLLARQDAQRIAIIGSGPVAAAHWRHVRALRPWQQVHIYSPNLKDDSESCAEWQSVCPNVVLAQSANAAVRDADVVMLCTSSGTPVVDHTMLKSNALVTSISTNVHRAHEVLPAFLADAQVYCDYRATTPTTAGEMVIAAEDHGWSAGAVRGDLAELSIGTCPLPDEVRPIFFRSVGLGLEDIAVAHAIYRAACAE